jgi:chromosomal replication initiator protein
VKGDSNQFAVATCLSAAENPGKAYNPLFIYGSTGLGKTHLLHAVGNRVLANNPGAVVTYIPSERFMNEMIYCLRFSKMWDFRQKYRSCDVFLVDDIQFISGKKATQEEFFHTFNTLYSSKKQIVITSDLFPKDIPDIEDRLRNRFQWGLIADIQPPSIEHRIAILYSKAEKLGIRMRDDVAEYIAKHAKRNVRELEGALHRINAFAALQGESITMDLAVRTFRDVLGEPPKRLTIETVQKTVADHFKLRVADLKSKRRQRAFAHPRQIAMFLARKLTNASYPEIGEKFGGKDHTTVMHNVRKIEDTLDKDLDLKAHVEALERQLEQLQ